jgi:hypothetical protein
VARVQCSRTLPLGDYEKQLKQTTEEFTLRRLVGAWVNYAGRVLVYKWNGTSYGQGGKIVGEVNDDSFGFSVSHSGVGKILAVGAPYYDKRKNDGSGEKENCSGNVHMFELDF